MDYSEAWDLQKRLVNARKDRSLDRDIILILEHPPVFTLGRRGGLANLRVSESFLAEKGIKIIHVERGGNITYHGRGQLVVYPIMDLRLGRFKVVDFVGLLENVMIRTLSDWGIKGVRNPKNRGVWVEENKIGSIGLAVQRDVSFHGLALNVNVSLEPFNWINTCGMKGVKITSMKQILAREIAMADIRHAISIHLREVLGIQLEEVDLVDINSILSKGKKILAKETISL
jgi:lipoate-protein ligase B